MTLITRRSALAGLAAATGLAFAGCGRTATTSARAGAMTVYRDPSCGCCTAWARIARNAGYEVAVVDHPDMAAIKRRYGVPDQLLSCHTSVIGGYAVEGHVPLEAVRRLLKTRPAGIKGIGVAGMPLGSPGMEVPDGTKQPFEVMAFDESGRIRRFAS